MHKALGRTFKCKITNFVGIATGRIEYITGCSQLLLTPQVGTDGSLKDGAWIDEQRLEQQEAENIVLDNGKTPGFGQAPPKQGI